MPPLTAHPLPPTVEKAPYWRHFTGAAVGSGRRSCKGAGAPRPLPTHRRGGGRPRPMHQPRFHRRAGAPRLAPAAELPQALAAVAAARPNIAAMVVTAVAGAAAAAGAPPCFAPSAGDVASGAVAALTAMATTLAALSAAPDGGGLEV